MEFVVPLLNGIQAEEPLCTIYLFGSVLLAESTPSDVDVLVVYEDSERLDGVKQKLMEIDLLCPLDVIFLSKDEENELRFVAGQYAVLVENLKAS